MRSDFKIRLAMQFPAAARRFGVADDDDDEHSAKPTTKKEQNGDKNSKILIIVCQKLEKWPNKFGTTFRYETVTKLTLLFVERSF